MKKNRRRRRLPSMVLVSVLLAGSVFFISRAWMIDQQAKQNDFRVAETETTIVEDRFEQPDELKPGTEFNKNPKVVNTGSLPCYVRMRAEFSVPSAAGFAALTGLPGTGWEYNAADGYYYYNRALAPGETTTELFTGVKIDDNAAATDIEEFEVIVYSESVESEETGASDEWETVWEKYRGGGA